MTPLDPTTKSNVDFKELISTVDAILALRGGKGSGNWGHGGRKGKRGGSGKGGGLKRIGVKPKDAYSATFIDTGKVDERTAVARTKANVDFEALLQTAETIRNIRKDTI